MRLTKCLFLVLLAASFVSCATAPKAPQGPVSAGLLLVPEMDLVKKFGAGNEDNPFLAPGALLTGRPKDFAVLALKLSLPEPSSIELQAAITGPGVQQSEIMDAARLKDFLFAFNVGTKSEIARDSMIGRICIPASSFTLSPGVYDYYIVVACKHPFTEGAHIVAQVYINGAPTASIDKELPPPIVVKSLFGGA